MQIERDKRLVESLISSKKTDAFVRRYREVIFDIIDKQMKKIDSSATLTLAKKGQLMSNFIDNLLTNDAKLLQNYLHPKRLRANNTDTEDLPFLDDWIHRQCVHFFSAKLIIDGIFSLNINVIKTFFFSKGRPGCREIFSGWIFENKIFSGSYKQQEKFIDNTIHTFVNELCATMEKFHKEEAEIRNGTRKRHSKQKNHEHSTLTSIRNYRYEKKFYPYFRDYVVHPYLEKKFFKPSIKTSSLHEWLLQLSYFPKSPTRDLAENIISNTFPEFTRKNYEKICQLLSCTKEDLKKAIRLLSKLGLKSGSADVVTVSIDDDRDDRENGKPTEIGSPDDSFREYEYRDSLKRIFCVMERTSRGRRQAKILKLVFHIDSYKNTAVETEKEIARILNISPRMLTYEKQQALKTANKIAKAENLNFD